jgi:hypothetical protein
MTRNNGGVVETCQQMEYVRMTEKKIAIEGDWYTLQFFNEDDGQIRVEMYHQIRNKFYKIYPDNKIGGNNDTRNEESQS